MSFDPAPNVSLSRIDALGPFHCPACRGSSLDPLDAVRGYCPTCQRVTGFPINGYGNKILVLGDTHGAWGWLAHEVFPFALSAGCETIVQVGDFGFVWDIDRANVDVVLDRLDDMLALAGLRIVFLWGNHENHPMLAQLAASATRNEDGHYELRERVLYTGREPVTWKWAGLTFAAVGGAASVDRHIRAPGRSWWPEEILSPAEVEAACDLGPVDILLTHDAPTGVPMRLMPNLESAEHRHMMTRIGRALRPSYWLHGHYHKRLSYGFEHDGGICVVRALDRDYSARHDAMIPLNLQAVRQSIDVVQTGQRGEETA